MYEPRRSECVFEVASYLSFVINKTREFHDVKSWSAELVAVSNNKLVAIAIVAGYELRIIVLNLAIKKKINQDFPYPVDIPVFRAEFYNNEDFVMPQIINNYCLILKVYSRLLKGATFMSGIIYVYSVENSMLLSRCQIIKEIENFKFILFDDEERLLLFYSGDKLDIRDPYNLQHVIENESISILYKELLNDEASTKLDISSDGLMNEKIYYMLEGCLWVQKISKKQCIEYLQKRSQGSDKIRVLPKKSQIEEILQKLISEGNNYMSSDSIKKMKSYEGSLVKWEVNGKENIIRAFKKVDSNAWEDVDSIKLEDFRIPSSTYYELTDYAPMFIISCGLLHNDDLAVITSFGLFIWSTWQKDEKIKKIRVLYYMSYGDRKTYVEVKNLDFINLLNKIQKNKKSSLPAPDFEFLYERKHSYTEYTKDHRLLLKELLDNLLDDYIEDNKLMKLYRQELLEFCSKFQLYSLAEKLCNKICSDTNLMKLCGEDFLKDNLNNSEESNTNMFINLDTAYLAVYMMLTGDSSSVSNWSLTDNLTLTFLLILFSFFTTIYLMNLFIGLLSDSISNTNKKELFLFQKAKIISEIELFYMLPYQRRKNNWFPELL
ncbi:hypothetical protein C2G38_2038940 [Gigaspora rosea]|uniref:Ion transport domain-containing protein n=1 Tax=Gigaspora rosea TaxID=44941 RepID=A0A397V4Y9_9GLOM|nr:hypothetical protein C2G38_2038940 [Gigaspora rosea]